MTKVTDLPAVTQPFISSDNLLVSKHVNITSGLLTIGEEYTILDFNTGDNFSNVANVISGTINTTGCVFIATGTTPTTYSNGSTLAYYQSQKATITQLGGLPKVYKALLTQSGTNPPVATVLVNTLSGTPVWSREDVGIYPLTSTGEFPALKTYISGQLITATARAVLIPVYKPSGGGNITIDGYYTFYRSDDDVIYLETYDETGISPVEFSTLFNGSTLALPTIEVYP